MTGKLNFSDMVENKDAYTDSVTRIRQAILDAYFEETKLFDKEINPMGMMFYLVGVLSYVIAKMIHPLTLFDDKNAVVDLFLRRLGENVKHDMKEVYDDYEVYLKSKQGS
jgi:hypothetical protein